jgi:hypothetical protein
MRQIKYILILLVLLVLLTAFTNVFAQEKYVYKTDDDLYAIVNIDDNLINIKMDNKTIYLSFCKTENNYIVFTNSKYSAYLSMDYNTLIIKNNINTFIFYKTKEVYQENKNSLLK